MASLDRADYYMDNVTHVTTWEEAAAHMALFLLWSSQRGLAREPVPVEQWQRPFREFLGDFVGEAPLVITGDDLCSEGELFAAEHYDAFVSQFAPSRRAQSVYHERDGGLRSTFAWLDSALAEFRRARGGLVDGVTPKHLTSAMSELLAQAGQPLETERLARLVAEIPASVQAVLEAPPAREWTRFTVAPRERAHAPGDARPIALVRPVTSAEYTDYGARELLVDSERAFAGERDVTAELELHDRLEVFGEAACVEWLLERLDPSRERLSEAAWKVLVESCFFVRVSEASEDTRRPLPAGSLVSPREFKAHVESCLSAGCRPPVGQSAFISLPFVWFYQRPWNERTGMHLIPDAVMGGPHRWPERADGPLEATYRAGTRRIEYAGRTHLGRFDGITRERVLLQPDVELFCVVAGFGVAPGLSASAAADPIRDTFEALGRAHPAGLPPSLARPALVESIERGHQGIRRLLPTAPPNAQLGATLAAVLLLGARALVAHVGAERVVRWRDDRIEQLTEDHSLLNDYLRKYDVPEWDVERVRREFPHKGVIVRALGVQAKVDAEVHEHELEPGDWLAITTERLSDALGLQELANAFLQAGTAEELAERLMEKAVEREPLQNHTVVVIGIE